MVGEAMRYDTASSVARTQALTTSNRAPPSGSCAATRGGLGLHGLYGSQPGHLDENPFPITFATGEMTAEKNVMVARPAVLYIHDVRSCGCRSSSRTSGRGGAAAFWCRASD